MVRVAFYSGLHLCSAGISDLFRQTAPLNESRAVFPERQFTSHRCLEFLVRALKGKLMGLILSERKKLSMPTTISSLNVIAP